MSSDSRDDAAVPRRDFLKQTVVTAGVFGAAAAAGEAAGASRRAPADAVRTTPGPDGKAAVGKRYNDAYTGDRLSRVAFPMGGLGAGMVCLEGAGALSHVSIRNKPDVFNEPCVFAAVSLKGRPDAARVLEGPVPAWKLFGPAGTGNGAGGKTYGLPRFRQATFRPRFPFATVALADPAVPIAVEITGWSPFEPGDADHASLPVAGSIPPDQHRPFATRRRVLVQRAQLHGRRSSGSGCPAHRSGVRPLAGGDRCEALGPGGLLGSGGRRRGEGERRLVPRRLVGSPDHGLARRRAGRVLRPAGR